MTLAAHGMWAAAFFAGTLVGAVPAMAQDGITGDPEAGERVFRKCQACHAVGEGAENKVGPVLNGVLGRAAASLDGYAYSAAMIAAGDAGTVWDDAALDAYLAAPRDFVDGTKMTFAGLRKEEERANVIAYLAGFAADGTTREEGS